MTPFETVWETSQHNAWSGYYYATIAIGILCLLMAYTLRRNWIVFTVGLGVVGAFTFGAYYCAWLESEAKWTIRTTWATANPELLTEQDRFVMADRMAINRPFGPILAGGGAFMMLGSFGTILFAVKALQPARQNPRN